MHYVFAAPLPETAISHHPTLAQLEAARAVFVTHLVRVEEACEGAGLSMREFLFLDHIVTCPAQRQSEVGEALSLDRTTTMKLLDELEGKGLAARQKFPNDRRSWAVVATADGERAVAQVLATLDA